MLLASAEIQAHHGSLHLSPKKSQTTQRQGAVEAYVLKRYIEDLTHGLPNVALSVGQLHVT